MRIYDVIQCTACTTLTFIRSTQKTYTCKQCGAKNAYTKIKTGLTAREARDHVVAKKSRPSGGFTWGTGAPVA